MGAKTCQAAFVPGQPKPLHLTPPICQGWDGAHSSSLPHTHTVFPHVPLSSVAPPEVQRAVSFAYSRTQGHWRRAQTEACTLAVVSRVSKPWPASSFPAQAPKRGLQEGQACFPPAVPRRGTSARLPTEHVETFSPTPTRTPVEKGLSCEPRLRFTTAAWRDSPPPPPGLLFSPFQMRTGKLLVESKRIGKNRRASPLGGGKELRGAQGWLCAGWH